jgi:uncharacterized protein (TIGR01777 family)
MHILLTGGTGFIGTALCERLRQEGHQLTILTRRPRPGQRYVTRLDEIDNDERIDAVINLAGASLAERRWTTAYKREIVASRLDTTRDLLDLVRRLAYKPHTLLSASAIGYYGHHGDEELDESGPCTPGFSQDLCRQWEELALEAADLGLRVCLLRLGVVFDRRGGAFARMALPFRFGMGNWLGSGRQWLSWVHRRDVIGAIVFLLQRSDLQGPFNITAPQPVTSRGFNDAMKRHRRVWLSAPLPAAMMRLAVGEMADELLLNGQRVLPAALRDAGFSFEFPDLDAALADIL